MTKKFQEGGARGGGGGKKKRQKAKSWGGGGGPRKVGGGKIKTGGGGKRDQKKLPKQKKKNWVGGFFGLVKKGQSQHGGLQIWQKKMHPNWEGREKGKQKNQGGVGGGCGNTKKSETVFETTRTKKTGKTKKESFFITNKKHKKRGGPNGGGGGGQRGNKFWGFIWGTWSSRGVCDKETKKKKRKKTWAGGVLNSGLLRSTRSGQRGVVTWGGGVEKCTYCFNWGGPIFKKKGNGGGTKTHLDFCANLGNKGGMGPKGGGGRFLGVTTY